MRKRKPVYEIDDFQGLKAQNAEDEKQLAVIVLTVILGGLIILALHYTGTFDKLIYKAAEIISFII